MKHGGDLTEAKARHGAGDPPWLDLSTGINPQSWPVPDALRHAGWERLPEAAEMDALLDAARAAYRVPDGAAIVAAPGTQAIIQWLPHLAPPGAVGIDELTYGGHAEAWLGAGRAVVQPDSGAGEAPSTMLRMVPLPLRGRRRGGAVRVSSPAGGGGPPEGRWRGHPARHRVIVNPNNPDGRIVDHATLRVMAEFCADAGGWLVVDEAFADLDPTIGAAGLVPDLPVVVLRSFGKFWGLAGLRLGFAIAPPVVAGQLRAALGDWAVSGPALAIGTAALADRGWAEATRARLVAEASALDEVLSDAGLAPAGGTSLFRLVRHPEATAIHRHLASRHIWCRRFEHAPDLLRIGLPADQAGLARLREALRHVQGTRIASPATLAR